MRPRPDATVLEVVSVRLAHWFASLRFRYRIRDTIFLSVCNRVLLRVKGQLNLCCGIRGTGPAHQRINRFAAFTVLHQQPLFGAGRAGLHRSFGWPINARSHRIVPVS
jgi:DsbC/DsbD-like thiol-disulfide interchange protein